MSDAYRRSGVDTEAAAKAITLIADLASQTRRPEVAGEVGGFAGKYDDQMPSTRNAIWQ